MGSCQLMRESKMRSRRVCLLPVIAGLVLLGALLWFHVWSLDGLDGWLFAQMTGEDTEVRRGVLG